MVVLWALWFIREDGVAWGGGKDGAISKRKGATGVREGAHAYENTQERKQGDVSTDREDGKLFPQ